MQWGPTDTSAGRCCCSTSADHRYVNVKMQKETAARNVLGFKNPQISQSLCRTLEELEQHNSGGNFIQFNSLFSLTFQTNLTLCCSLSLLFCFRYHIFSCSHHQRTSFTVICCKFETKNNFYVSEVIDFISKSVKNRHVDYYLHSFVAYVHEGGRYLLTAAYVCWKKCGKKLQHKILSVSFLFSIQKFPCSCLES